MVAKSVSDADSNGTAEGQRTGKGVATGRVLYVSGDALCGALISLWKSDKVLLLHPQRNGGQNCVHREFPV